jgi:hypothetical protein
MNDMATLVEYGKQILNSRPSPGFSVSAGAGGSSMSNDFSAGRWTWEIRGRT